MVSILEFNTITPELYAEYVCDRDGCICNSPVYNWLMFGKLPIDEYVKPGYADKTITAGMKNRYLNTVHVYRIPVITISITSATDAVDTFTISGAYSATSSNVACATAGCEDEKVTITGVDDGSTVVTVKDINGKVIATINVTIA